MIGIKSLVTGLGDLSDVDVDWARVLPAGPLQQPQKMRLWRSCSRIRGVTGDTSGSKSLYALFKTRASVLDVNSERRLFDIMKE